MNKIIIGLCILMLVGCSNVQSTPTEKNEKFEYYMTCYSGGKEIIPRTNLGRILYVDDYVKVTVKGSKRVIRTNADCIIDQIEKSSLEPYEYSSDTD